MRCRLSQRKRSNETRAGHNTSMKTTPGSVRLYAILARKSPVAVVFRRGPSNSVLLIKWNTADDTFEFGQWLRGRIYERRCDLSPDGGLLLYFAANYREPLRSWSAISRPPFLKALALWPKGDGWGGGGHFQSHSRIALSHRAGEMALAPGFSVPRWLKVRPFGDRPGWGEDDPVWSERLLRDGWNLISIPTATKDDFGAKVWLEFSPPIVWRKSNPVCPKRYSLDMSIIGMKERSGPWYLTEHAVTRENGESDKLGRSEWADWSDTGDLLFSMGGCLYRVPCRKRILAPLEDAVKVADFTNLKFEPVKAPDVASRWPKR
jgi:hypothetical protein